MKTKRGLQVIALIWLVGLQGIVAPKLVAAQTEAAAPSELVFEAPTRQAERLLLEVLHYISEGNMDLALTQVQNLTERHPDYHLAQLIKADLWAFRAGDMALLERVGSLYPITVRRLREEAQVRWQFAHSDESLVENLLHSSVLKVGKQQHLVLINLAKSRLYLYQVDNGHLDLITDYYVSMGTGGAGKEREGDRKTPIGVYHITDFVPGERLADLYGYGALPLNYPNIWDQSLGRTGHGIWLHGTPSDTFSRPPQSSQGCVVLNNEEMGSLVSKFNVSVATPVIIVNQAEDLMFLESERLEVLSEVQHWLASQGEAFNWADVSVYSYPNEAQLYYATFPDVRREGHLIHQYWRRDQEGAWQLVLQSTDPVQIATRLN
ncbi:L,D-transpeptidase family protein [Thiomicrospira aerophila]|uniref:L,D-transpeptidase family protein n=1 Tax=Thiomicrospira aerophila TaxID=92245 RepID=UPI00022C14F3|nr:L,D-transpeptidase family protein [Thiomicrospira aerophila]